MKRQPAKKVVRFTVHGSQFTVGRHASIIIGNAKFGNIDNLLSQGHDMVTGKK